MFLILTNGLNQQLLIYYRCLEINLYLDVLHLSVTYISLKGVLKELRRMLKFF